MLQFKVTENYTLDVEDHLDFKEDVFNKALNIWGFGQDHHSVDGTPEYYVVRLRKEDYIHHNGDIYKALSFYCSINEIHLQLSYSEAKYNASEYDGWGKGFCCK